MLKTLELTNFKCFGDKHKIPMAPITLIFGPNSAGKSSIIKALNVLKQSMQLGAYDGCELVLSHPASFVDCGSFQNTVYNHEIKRGIQIKLDLDHRYEPDHDFEVIEPIDPDQSKRELSHGIVGFTYRHAGWINTIDFNQNWKSLRFPEAILSQVENEKQKQDLAYFGMKGYNLLPSPSLAEEDENGHLLGFDLHEYLEKSSCNKSFQRFIENLYSVSAVRYLGSRLPFQREVKHTPNPGIDGSKLGSFLINHERELENLNQALLDVGVRYEVTVEQLTETDFALVKLKDLDRAGVEVFLSDVGTGLSQILPILTSTSMMQWSTICVEQPELHIHPRLQTELASQFVKSYKENHNQFIIETHSEHIILRMQREIRHGNLALDDLSILYVGCNNSGTYVEPIQLDEDGELLDPWPGGFFPERMDEIFG